MKLRGLSIALIVLAGLTGVLYWSNHRKPDRDAAVKASASAPLKVLSVDPANVQRLAIHRPDQPEIDLARNSSGAWQITAPKNLGADQDAVAGVLTTLSTLNADRLIDDHPTDLAQYGLSTPALEIDLGTKDNKTQKLLVGDQTPTGGDYYFMLGGDPRLFTFATTNKSSIDKTTDDLRDRRLLTADFDHATQIEFLSEKAGAKQDITFGHEKDAWQIVKPAPIRTASDQVDALIQSLKDAEMDLSSPDDAKNAAAYNSSMPFAAAKVTGSFGTQELDVRKDKDDYYAKSSVIPGVYKLDMTGVSGFNKSLDDFRTRGLFDFGYTDPDKVEVHDGAKAYFMTHSGSDWWGADGKKLDPTSVQALLSTLNVLSASSFPTSGFTSPVIEITVVSGGGKSTEKVSIAKDGDSYVAKRENEPELYGLAASGVTDLEAAAAGVKPASGTHK